MRGRKTERLGVVRAWDEAEAMDKAMAEFDLEPRQRRRLLVWRDE